ncbi:hypothetical protein GCM10023220_61300 [Streptomyces ziwulingensis]|uniref:Uncharacterized protein n=1 Tax=Streptomyces ziwulingensis TaxID=1045501 RepID=A0ABP9CW54_9ACTN
MAREGGRDPVPGRVPVRLGNAGFSRAVEVSTEGSGGRTALHPAITLCLYRTTSGAQRPFAAGRAWVSGTVAARPRGAGHL